LTALLHLKSLVPFAAEWWYTFPGIISIVFLIENTQHIFLTIPVSKYYHPDHPE